ncbi:hypothetical protein RclHR1_04050002 [Rhizophagus clarus]|uniref:Uncharacterized protein n=1 Tax=Rhizophagus clarus TaxID=94130 RepID=A0A2Z6S9J4_9GLOM|nr:hypothetical protein RclHR1_04050002 [Rhizophagus clarus]GES76022.1 hypothetical protein RCL_jg20316.t1 [Rhizophagus clarus]
MFHHVARSAVLQTVANLLQLKFSQVTDFSSYDHTKPVAPVAQDPIVVSGSSTSHQPIPTIGTMDVDLLDITTSKMPTSSSGKQQVHNTPDLVSAPTNTSALKSPGKKSKSADDQCPKKDNNRIITFRFAKTIYPRYPTI